MVEMAKGLVWPMAFINVRPIRCGQLDGIGNGMLVAQLLEEYWGDNSALSSKCRNGNLSLWTIGYNALFSRAICVSAAFDNVRSRSEAISHNIFGKENGKSRPCGIVAWSA